MIANGERDRLRAQLRRDEGLRLKAYVDTTGHISIGYGRNLDDVGISRAMAEQMLDEDIDGAVHALVRAHPWITDLDPARQRVLVNMAFNLGVRGLLKWTYTLAAVQAGDYERAAHLMDASLWKTQVKDRAVRLIATMRDGKDR